MIRRLLDPEAWTEIAQVAARNPVRTGLTALGVFWGAFMLVLMLGFGAGLQQGVLRGMGNYATNAVYLWGQARTLAHQGHTPGQPIRFRVSDQAALERLPGVDAVCSRLQLGGWRDSTITRRGAKTGTFQIMGDTPTFGRILNVVYDGGRFINPLDEAQLRKVAVIGAEVRRTLFEPHEEPLGQWIEVRGVAFLVVGVFHARQANDEGDRQESTIHIPFQTFRQVFHTGDRVGWYALLADADTKASTIDEAARATLSRVHGVNPNDNRAIGSRNAQEEFDRLSNLFAGIRWLVWVVGGATLASGVVGVSNILLIVVRERSAEIGLRRALGATPTDIVLLIVGEAIVLTGLSGLAGIIAGVAVITAAAAVIGPDHPSMGVPSVNVGAALAAAALLVVAGAGAGFLPARRALAVHPVTALRAE
jgi:putative ABC transport system permease protein